MKNFGQFVGIMENKKLASRLRRLETELQRLIADVEGHREEVGKCLWCGKPVYEGEKLIRGVHMSSCYHFLRDRVDNGEMTWESLEAQQKVLPPSKPGRKKLTPDEHRQAQKEAGESIARKVRKSKK